MAAARRLADSTPALPAPERHDRAPTTPALAPAAGAVLALQQAAGNAAVARVLQRHTGGGCTCGGTCKQCAHEGELEDEHRSRSTPTRTIGRIDRCACTSPPAELTRADLEEEPIELTVPSGPLVQRFFGWGWWGAGSGSGSAPATKPCHCVEGLDVKGTGAIEGSYGIDDYWPGVTPYWGAHKTLGEFNTAGSGKRHTLGHKFQVVGRFSTKQSAAGGQATFKQKARLTHTKGGTAGAWFDDMDYTDAGGGKHHWDPNAEAGTTVKTGYPGVRRTIATDKYAYTDPPAISYEEGTTNTYRGLDFDIHFSSAPGCPCSILDIGLSRSQEIEVKNGVPTVIKAP